MPAIKATVLIRSLRIFSMQPTMRAGLTSASSLYSSSSIWRTSSGRATSPRALAYGAAAQFVFVLAFFFVMVAPRFVRWRWCEPRSHSTHKGMRLARHQGGSATVGIFLRNVGNWVRDVAGHVNMGQHARSHRGCDLFSQSSQICRITSQWCMGGAPASACENTEHCSSGGCDLQCHDEDMSMVEFCAAM